MYPTRALPIRPAIAVILTLILTAAAACSSAPDASEPVSSYTSLADQCDPKLAASLKTWGDQGYSGSLTVLGGDRECNIGLGFADRDAKAPVTSDSAFSIGSITKPVVAAAIFQLADDGVLSVDDPVSQHVDGLTGDVNDLTIKHLLLHTSGLNGTHGDDHVPMSKAEAIDAISQLPIDTEPGTEWTYTNAGFTLLGLVIDEVTAEGYRTYVADNILRDGDGAPLGGFWDGTPAVDSPRAYGYLKNDELGEIGDFDGPHWGMDGNGGMALTTLEMAEWTRAFFSGDLLSPEATEAFLSTRKNVGDGSTELPGWGELPPKTFGERSFLTSGGGGGIGHSMDVAWLPDTERVMVIAKSDQSKVTQDLPLDIAFPLISGTGIPSPPTVNEAEPELISAMTGTFQIGDDDTNLIEISVKENGLQVNATGPDALAAVMPTPDGYEAEFERNEGHAQEFTEWIKTGNGGSLEMETLRQEYESKHEKILDADVVATVLDGFVITIVELKLATGTDTLVLEFNKQGGLEGHNFGPTLTLGKWFVYDSDTTFVLFRPFPEEPELQLRATDTGIEIDGPYGTVAATRLE